MLWDNIFINAVGTYLPQRVSAETIGQNAATNDKHADVSFESITKTDMPAHVMAGLAVKQAVENSDHADDMLSPIVYSTLPFPGGHMAPVCYIQRILRQPQSLAFGLEAACDGGMAGIEVVARILSGSSKIDAGIVSAANRCPNDADRWVAGNLLGDGAAAVIISKKTGFAQLIASRTASEPDLEALVENTATQSDAADFPLTKVGLGPYLETIAQTVWATIFGILAEAELSLDDISYFCPPTFSKVSFEEIYLRRGAIPIEKTCWPELQKNGHVGPCDQILGIAHLIDTGRLKQGAFVMLMGGGLPWRFTCTLVQVV